MSDQSTNNTNTVPKIYLGNLKEKTRENGDKFLVGSLCLNDIDEIPAEHKTTGTNNKTYVRIIVNPFRNGANQYGNTHSIAIDTFKPDKDKQ